MIVAVDFFYILVKKILREPAVMMKLVGKGSGDGVFFFHSARERKRRETEERRRERAIHCDF